MCVIKTGFPNSTEILEAWSVNMKKMASKNERDTPMSIISPKVTLHFIAPWIQKYSVDEGFAHLRRKL